MSQAPHARVPEPEDETAIRRVLRYLRLRLSIRAGLIVALGYSALAGLSHATGRLPLWALLVSAGGGAAALFLVLRNHGPGKGEPAVTTLLEKRYPAFRSDLTTLLEWKRRNRRSRFGFSEELLAVLEGDVTARLASLPLRNDFGLRALLRRERIWIAALLGVLTFSSPLGTPADLWRRAREAQTVRQTPPGWLSGAAPLSVGNLTADFDYPAYTGLGPKRGKAIEGNPIEGIRGTKVRLSFQAVPPMGELGLILPGGEYVPSEESAGDRNLTFALRESGPYGFRGIDSKGVRRQDETVRQILVVPDEAPKVRILKPDRTVETDRRGTQDFLLSAEDDFGLSYLQLELRGTSFDQKIPLKGATGRSFSAGHRLELSKLPIPEGETSITVTLVARDNDTVSGPKEARSEPVTLKFKDTARERADRLSSMEKLRDRFLTLLADDLENPPSSAVWTKGTIELKNLIGDLQTAAGDARLKTILRSFGDRLIALLAARTDLEKRPDGGDREGLRKKEIAALEEVILFMDRWFTRERMEDLSSALEGASRTSDRLLRKLSDPSARIDQGELASMVKELREEARKLSESLAALAQRGSPEFMNPEALEGKDLNSFSSEMNEIQKLLDQGKTAEARKRLAQQLERLRELTKSMKEGSRAMSRKGNEALRRRFEEVMGELKKTREGQEKLMEETRRLRDRMEKERNGLSESKTSPIERKIRELKKALGLARAESAFETSEPWKSLTRRNLPRAEATAATLERNLKDMKLDSALRNADFVTALLHDLTSSARELRGVFDRTLPPADRGKLLRGYASTEKAERLAREIRDLLQRLTEESPLPKVSPQDRSEMERLSKEQGLLGERTGKLRERVGELGRKLGAEKSETEEPLREAERDMKSGREKLDAQQPAPAVANQKDAVEHLERIEKNFENMSREGAGSELGWSGLPPSGESDAGEGGIGISNEEVLLPESTRSKEAEEWRQKLMEGMKGKPPAGYEDATRKYFEELIR